MVVLCTAAEARSVKTWQKVVERVRRMNAVRITVLVSSCF